MCLGTLPPGEGGGLPDERSARISQKHTEAPVSIWLHLSCEMNLNAENETNSTRAAVFTLHAGCRKLKDFDVWDVLPHMTTTGWFELLQEHMETIQVNM